MSSYFTCHMFMYFHALTFKKNHQMKTLKPEASTATSEEIKFIFMTQDKICSDS